MYCGFQNINEVYNKGINKLIPLTYDDGRATYGKWLRFHEPNKEIEDQLSLLKLNELVVNDGFALPYCHFSCAAIDNAENKFMTVGASNGDVYVINLDQAAEGEKNAAAQYKKRPITADGHAKRIIDCEWFKNDAASFITCSRDNSVKLWDTANFEVVDTYKDFDEHTVYQIDWNGIDPYLIAVALGSSVVKFVDSAVGSSVQQIRWKTKHISCVRWYPQNGHYIFVGSMEGSAAFFDIRQSKIPLIVLKDGKYSAFDTKVERARFTLDGTKVVVSSADMIMKGFDLNTGNIIMKKRPVRGVNKPTSPKFDLFEEGGELFVALPLKRKIKLTKIDMINNDNSEVDEETFEQQPLIEYISPLDRILNFEITNDIFLDGFLADTIGVVYRRERQHVIGYGTTESALIFTPKSDIKNKFDISEENNLHVDDWSSDDDF